MASRRSHSLPQHPFVSSGPVVLVSGRLEAYKHPVGAVDALSFLPAEVTLKITGDGPERAALERRIRQQQLTERAQLLGRVSDGDLRRWMRTANVLVSMSEHEAYGIVLLEALAAGASVVAWDTPGAPGDRRALWGGADPAGTRRRTGQRCCGRDPAPACNCENAFRHRGAADVGRRRQGNAGVVPRTR